METTTETKPQNGNRPVRKVRAGLIEASIWLNEGKNGAYYTVSFERRFQDGASGEWRSLKSFRSSDLFSLLGAGFQAYQALAELEAAGGSQ